MKHLSWHSYIKIYSQILGSIDQSLIPHSYSLYHTVTHYTTQLLIKPKWLFFYHGDEEGNAFSIQK